MNRYKTIMLVEDDLDDQQFFTEAIHDIDPKAHCVIADNGYEALQLLARLPAVPDIIFLDLLTPKMNGIEFLKAIRKEEKYKSLPVVVFSHYDYYLEECYALNVAAAVGKSYDLDNYTASLKDLLSLDMEKDAGTLRTMYPLRWGMKGNC